MLTLNSVTLKNFMCYANSCINFKKKGIYFISGVDQNTGGSNGTGKSAIVSSICFALFGKTEKGVMGKDLIRWGAKDLLVELSMLNEKNEEIIITRTHDTVSISINGVVHTGGKTQMQKLINDTFNTNYYLFISSLLFSSSEVEFLSDQGDLDKKKLFKSLLKMGIIDKSYEAITDKLSIINKVADKNSSRIENLKAQITLDTADLEKAEYEDSIFESTRSDRVRVLKSRKLDESADDFNEDDYNSLVLSVAHNDREKESFTKKLAKLSEEIDNHARKLYNLEYKIVSLATEISQIPEKGASCPTCKTKVGDDRDGIIKELDRQIQEATELKRVEEKELEERNSAAILIQKSLSSLRKNEDVLKEMTMKKYMLDTKREMAQKENKRIESDIERVMSEESPHKWIIEQLKKRIHTNTAELEHITIENDKVLKDIDVYSFLKWVMSREGIVVDIVRDYVKKIEGLTNKYLATLHRGILSIVIDTSRLLKKGVTKDEIAINVYKNKHKVNLVGGISDGQKQRINLCILLALYWLCRGTGTNPFNFLMLDEVLDLSLDKTGQEEFGLLLADLRKHIGHILIISHKGGISSSYDVDVTVKMNNDGVSSLVLNPVS